MKEEQIRPKKIFEKYLKLSKEDIAIFFKNKPKKKINCIACKSQGKKIFVKYSFQYDFCDKCFSIYASPRPDKKYFFNYYLNSKSSKFWATTFYKETAQQRREKLWKPKALMINNIIKKFNNSAKINIIDIGGGYGLFGEEISKYYNNVTIIEPANHLAEICKKKGLNVINKFLENLKLNDLPKGRKTFVSFELIEHLHNPNLFFTKMKKLMGSNDIFIFTTLSGAGIDIASLGKKSNSIMPPYHINFYNPFSIKIFLNKLNYEVIQVSTPGKLDLDILKNNSHKISSFLFKYILNTFSDKNIDKLQSFFSDNGLSSHMMVVCKKL